MTAGWFEGDAAAGAPEGMVTVARLNSPTEAQMARGMLESAGIECFLAGENINSILGGALRVRIQVRTEDEEAARELLASARESGPAE